MKRAAMAISILLAAAACLSVFASSAVRAETPLDTRLIGRWRESDKYAGTSGEYEIVFTLTLEANGKALREHTWGSSVFRDNAEWEADGTTLRLVSLSNPELEDTDGVYEYSVSGDTLTLRLTYEEEVMTLTREK
jgi:hypothetical protein